MASATWSSPVTSRGALGVPRVVDDAAEQLTSNRNTVSFMQTRNRIWVQVARNKVVSVSASRFRGQRGEWNGASPTATSNERLGVTGCGPLRIKGLHRN